MSDPEPRPKKNELVVSPVNTWVVAPPSGYGAVLVVFVHQIDDLCNEAEALRTARAVLPRYRAVTKLSASVAGATILAALGGAASNADAWFVWSTGVLAVIALVVLVVTYRSETDIREISDEALNRHISKLNNVRGMALGQMASAAATDADEP